MQAERRPWGMSYWARTSALLEKTELMLHSHGSAPPKASYTPSYTQYRLRGFQGSHRLCSASIRSDRYQYMLFATSPLAHQIISAI